MKQAKHEQETIISFNEQDEEMIVYTYNKPLKTLLSKLEKKNPEECYKHADYQFGAGCYKVPKSWLKIAPPKKLSAKQIKDASNRMKQRWEEEQSSETVSEGSTP
jgi:hypothetical protein